MFCLDTILVNQRIALKDLKGPNIVFTQFKKGIIHTNSIKVKNTVPITILDTNLNLTEITLKIPDSIDIDNRNGIFGIGVGEKNLFLFYGTFYFLFDFSVEKKIASFKQIVNLNRTYNNYYVLNDSTFISTFLYNTSLPQDKVIISKFLANKTEPIKSVYPNFDCIEFSHFAPNHWFEINEKYIAFSQTCEYKITIFDLDLNVVDSIIKFEPKWSKINQDTLKNLRENKNANNPHYIIKHLGSINHKISKVVGVWLLNGNKLFVRYQMPKENNDTFEPPQIYFDVYQLIQKEDRFVDHKTLSVNIKDGNKRLNVADTVQKCNTYLLTWMHKTFFLKDYIIILKTTVDINYFNRPLREIIKEQNEVLLNTQPKTGLWIFKWDKNAD
jgi:hypothetical protein